MAAQPEPTEVLSDPASADVSDDQTLPILTQPSPGQILLGRYRFERKIGEGGMGSVWLVCHLELDTERALKLIVSGIASDPESRARFKREARVMARLNHPHAVIVHHAHLAKDAAFIEMEYIRGQGLNHLLAPGRPMPLDWITRILEQLCDVLQAAHDQGIVHRDLKPSNLMLLDGRPPGREFLKVLDFGIAKILGVEGEGTEAADDFRTRTGSSLYTPQYASPEQASASGVDHRSDLYSVGVMLYEFLTGHRPFAGPRIIYDHLFTPPPPFRSKNPAVVVAPELEQLVLRCLAKTPEDRPSSVRELFSEFLHATSQGAPAPPIASLSPDRTHRAIHQPTQHASGSGSRSAAPVAEPGHEPFERTLPFGSQHAPPKAVEPPKSVERPVAAASPVPAVGRLEPPPTPHGGRRRWTIGSLVVATLGFSALGVVLWPPSDHPRDRLPEGFVAESPGDTVNGRPRVLVHEKLGTRYILIEGGPFLMGDDDAWDVSDGDPTSSGPAHPVRVSDYYLQETEVTNAEMTAYFQEHGIAESDRPTRWREERDWIVEKAGRDPGPYPAVGISHPMAEDFARWLGGRLPTEAEWEYAARSQGQKRRYVWGDSPDPNRTLANIDSLGEHAVLRTSPVKAFTKDRTEQGIHDMTGNVREWCFDVLAPYPPTSEEWLDPRGPPRPEPGPPVRFVIRGSSFLSWSDEFSTTGPRYPGPNDRTTRELAEDGTASDLGFRIVIEAPRRQ